MDTTLAKLTDFVTGLKYEDLTPAAIHECKRRFIDSLASIGAAVNKADNQATLADENLLRMKSMLSQAEDTDYTEAITKMNKDMLALEAAQNSFAKISQLNLFDYIK